MAGRRDSAVKALGATRAGDGAGADEVGSRRRRGDWFGDGALLPVVPFVPWPERERYEVHQPASLPRSLVR
ncbi:hypothetical protein U9M48_000810 [Paspalum notatum var. saurae]|uniref:Uncharacterized protein n=1 Tax=Paspalum notatum var. saurae TaxID=547442 RepID=A0AAQ3SCJ9_PASNO